MLPLWFTTTAQVQPPPVAAGWQSADSKPMPPARGALIPLQFTVVPDSCRQPAGSCTTKLPVVVVPSLNVPLATAEKVPLTLSEPEIVGPTQLFGSRLAFEMSSFPSTFRQVELAVYVPTMLPPQAATLLQAPLTGPLPPPDVLDDPALGLPAAPGAPPDAGSGELVWLHAPDNTSPNVVTTTRAADWVFIEGFPSRVAFCRCKSQRGRRSTSIAVPRCDDIRLHCILSRVRGIAGHNRTFVERANAQVGVRRAAITAAA